MTKPPLISVVVNFFNMRREAKRTLFTLTPAYQRDADPSTYEVVAIDNGSSEPLDPSWVSSLGANFRHIYYSTDSPSPCAAINSAVRSVDSQMVTCMVDGARMLSPRILKYTLLAATLLEHPFIYTLAMHIGKERQNRLVTKGYNQTSEDALLESVPWRANGYSLFDISSLGGSSWPGFFCRLAESSCFTMRTDDFLAMGGLDEKFVGPGGGLANMDFFNRANEDPRLSPVMLLGEATFHQFHGGVATNVPAEMHPWKAMEEEYRLVRGRAYARAYRDPLYLGGAPKESLRFMLGE